MLKKHLPVWCFLEYITMIPCICTKIGLNMFAAPLVASSPHKAPSQGSSATTSVRSPGKKRHPNLILIFSIAAGVLILAIITVLVICSRALREEKAPDPHKEAGMYLFWLQGLNYRPISVRNTWIMSKGTHHVSSTLGS